MYKGKLIFVTGKMGAGKTTYCTERHKNGCDVLYIGRECRLKFGAEHMAKSKNPVAPDDAESFVRDLIHSEVDAHSRYGFYKDLYIDGVPRTREQVRWIFEYFSKYDPRILYLTCSRSERERRWTKRDITDRGAMQLNEARAIVENEIYLEVFEEIYQRGNGKCLIFKNTETNEMSPILHNTDLNRIFNEHNVFAEMVMNRLGWSIHDLYEEAKDADQLPQTSKSVEWARRFVEKASVELSELLREIPDTWWSRDMVDVRAARVELIDAIHFLISASMALGMDANAFAGCFYGKLQVNKDRQLTGYKKLDKKKDAPDDAHVGKAKQNETEI